MKQNYDTILFDLDGTLINTYELIIQSFLTTFNHYGFNEIKREDCYPFIGPTLDETFTKVCSEKREEMVEFYRKFNREMHDELVTEFESVYETVKTLSDKGYKLGVVTTKVRGVVEKGLKLANLEQFFPVVVTLDDVEHAKPNPEPLNKAMSLLQSKPEQTIMVGDSSHDIDGAKNAGVTSVGVLWSIKGEDYIKNLNPDYVIDSMKDLLPIVGVN